MGQMLFLLFLESLPTFRQRIKRKIYGTSSASAILFYVQKSDITYLRGDNVINQVFLYCMQGRRAEKQVFGLQLLLCWL